MSPPPKENPVDIHDDAGQDAGSRLYLIYHIYTPAMKIIALISDERRPHGFRANAKKSRSTFPPPPSSLALGAAAIIEELDWKAPYAVCVGFFVLLIGAISPRPVTDGRVMPQFYPQNIRSQIFGTEKKVFSFIQTVRLLCAPHPSSLRTSTPPDTNPSELYLMLPAQQALTSSYNAINTNTNTSSSASGRSVSRHNQATEAAAAGAASLARNSTGGNSTTTTWVSDRDEGVGGPEGGRCRGLYR